MSKVVSLEGLSRFWKNVNDKKQDKLVDGVNIATINGQSLTDGGDLTIEGGSLTESDIAAMGFTKNTGTYSKPSGGIPKSDLASAVQTSLGKADTAIQSTSFGELTDLAVVKGFESAQNGTVYTLPDCDTGDEDDILLSRGSVKTVNGQSIVGRGDITISGGSGGEDIRYFTDFTVEDFIEACESNNVITYDTTELFNAMKSNKVICVPYRGYDKGFIVASYRSGENGEYPDMYLQKGDVEYYAWTGDSHELAGEIPTFNSTQVVEIAGGEVVFEVLDNHIYRITDPVDYLFPIPNSMHKGATIHFMSGESGTTMEVYNIFWANGEIPQIEPNTHYELSLMSNSTYEYNAVLTKFKFVE